MSPLPSGTTPSRDRLDPEAGAFPMNSAIFSKYLSAAVPRIGITLANHSENTALLVIFTEKQQSRFFFPQMRTLRTRRHESIALAIVRNAVNPKNIACGHHLMNSTPAGIAGFLSGRSPLLVQFPLNTLRPSRLPIARP